VQVLGSARRWRAALGGPPSARRFAPSRDEQHASRACSQRNILRRD